MTTINTTPEVTTKPLAGTLFMKDAVELAPREDGTPRVMGVLHVATADQGVVRVTDFSKQHEKLVEGEKIRLVYEESTRPQGERLVTYRNLTSAVQG